ncbi:type II toxin-antitoxin system RelE/ParE family toxin [Massilia sp. B-10]|nr:type II toxin-antitoxin system RelE/ParE family toxin [Massilia sp. B-10]
MIFHDEFDPEFDALSNDVQDELLATAAAVKQLGPAADRPHVGTLDNPKHPNMKELRFKANHGAEIWRAVFAFDPNHDAIILVAADKQGIDEKKFYKNLLTKANSAL